MWSHLLCFGIHNSDEYNRLCNLDEASLILNDAIFFCSKVSTQKQYAPSKCTGPVPGRHGLNSLALLRLVCENADLLIRMHYWTKMMKHFFPPSAFVFRQALCIAVANNRAWNQWDGNGCASHPASAVRCTKKHHSTQSMTHECLLNQLWNGIKLLHMSSFGKSVNWISNLAVTTGKL